MVKSGKIAGVVPQQAMTKKPHGSYPKKKEDERSVIMKSVHPQYLTPMAHVPYYPYPYIVAAQYQQPPFQYQPHNQNQHPTPTQHAQTKQTTQDNRGQGQG